VGAKVTETQKITRVATRRLRRVSDGKPLSLKVESMSEPIVLPVEAIAALPKALDDIAAGVIPLNVEEEITTQELADLPTVSRPYVDSLLEAGEIRFRKVGAKRGVLRSEAVHYKHLDDGSRFGAARELTSESEEVGQCDIFVPPVVPVPDRSSQSKPADAKVRIAPTSTVEG
jgi:excisionase family DNA binding protein